MITIILLGGLILIILIMVILLYKYKKQTYESPYIREFEKYNAILKYSMDKAYSMIYKDELLIYSLDATRVSDGHFNEVTKRFNILVLKFLGSALEEEFVKFYGSYDALFFNMSSYFSERYEDDEIKKMAQENIINTDIEDTMDI